MSLSYIFQCARWQHSTHVLHNTTFQIPKEKNIWWKRTKTDKTGKCETSLWKEENEAKVLFLVSCISGGGDSTKNYKILHTFEDTHTLHASLPIFFHCYLEIMLREGNNATMWPRRWRNIYVRCYKCADIYMPTFFMLQVEQNNESLRVTTQTATIKGRIVRNGNIIIVQELTEDIAWTCYACLVTHPCQEKIGLKSSAIFHARIWFKRDTSLVRSNVDWRTSDILINVLATKSCVHRKRNFCRLPLLITFHTYVEIIKCE